jgi:macrolide transport system ATP-binding/permease protein
MNIIELKNIEKTYALGKLEVPVLMDIDLEVGQGEFVAIMGRSGSGKSTLLNILGLLDNPSKGSYKLFGTEILTHSDSALASLRNYYLGFIFQQFNLLQKLTVLENITLPLIYSDIKNPNHEDPVKLLKNLDLYERSSHYPNEVSGGQQQRTAIARAIINKPSIIFADEPTGNLDIKSSNDVMGILKNLNNIGISIIMVTHDSEVANFAKRIIEIKDGTITSDSKTPTKYNPTIPITQLTSLYKTKMFSIQKIKIYFVEAFRSLRTNKIRSTLSILGITMGTASLIAMLAVGAGSQKELKKNFESLFAKNLLTIKVGPIRQRTGSYSTDSKLLKLKREDIYDIKDNVSGVKSVAGYMSKYYRVTANDKNYITEILAASSEYLNLENSAVSTGRFFTELEDIAKEKVALLGKTVLREIYGNKDFNPIGKYIRINRIDFRIIGVLPDKNAVDEDYDDRIIIPLNTAIIRIFGAKNRSNLDQIDRIDVQVKDGEDIKKVSNDIIRRILFIRRLPQCYADAIRISDWEESKKIAVAGEKIVSFLLGSIAVISLLVGGTGIMNIMLISVSERTKEIGLKKAIGANNKDILFQFVIESIFICCTGGIIGILFGVGTSIVLGNLSVLGESLKFKTYITPFSLELAFGFSILIGLTFGIWPAVKASKLNPINALRHN